MYQKIKRGIDFVISLIGFIILSPLFILLCLAIKLDSPTNFFQAKESGNL